MRPLALAALLAVPAPASAQLVTPGVAFKDKVGEALDFLQLPNAVVALPFQNRGPEHAAALALIMDKSAWAEAFRRMDGRTGLLRTALIRVQLKDADLGGGHELAFVRGHDAAVHVRMNNLVATLKATPGRERETFVAIAAHELVHIYQQGWTGARPRWAVEGMAAYGGDELRHVHALPWDALPELDQARGSWAYGRGMLFFAFLERVFGPEAAQGFIQELVVQNRPWEEAAAKATGMDAASLKRHEQAWSARYRRELGRELARKR